MYVIVCFQEKVISVSRLRFAVIHGFVTFQSIIIKNTNKYCFIHINVTSIRNGVFYYPYKNNILLTYITYYNT